MTKSLQAKKYFIDPHREILFWCVSPPQGMRVQCQLQRSAGRDSGVMLKDTSAVQMLDNMEVQTRILQFMAGLFSAVFSEHLGADLRGDGEDVSTQTGTDN